MERRTKRRESYLLYKEPFWCERELCIYIQARELFMKTQISMAMKLTFCGRKEMSLGFKNSNRGTPQKRKHLFQLLTEYLQNLWGLGALLTLKSAFNGIIGGHGKSGGVGVRSRGHL